MKKLIALVMLMLLAGPAWGVHVQFNWTNQAGLSVTGRTFYLYPYPELTTNSFGGLVARDRLRTNTAHGSVVISNLLAGGYRGEMVGEYTTTTNWYVFPTSNGLVLAASYVTASTNTGAGLRAYTMAQSDSLLNAASNSLVAQIAVGGSATNAPWPAAGSGITATTNSLTVSISVAASQTNAWRADATNAAAGKVSMAAGAGTNIAIRGLRIPSMTGAQFSSITNYSDHIRYESAVNSAYVSFDQGLKVWDDDGSEVKVTLANDGTVTATSFVGDGSGLTGISSSGALTNYEQRAVTLGGGLTVTNASTAQIGYTAGAQSSVFGFNGTVFNTPAGIQASFFKGVLPSTNVNGVIPIANLATGTPDGTKFIRDDGTLVAPGGSGDVVAAGNNVLSGSNYFGGNTTFGITPVAKAASTNTQVALSRRIDLSRAATSGTGTEADPWQGWTNVLTRDSYTTYWAPAGYYTGACIVFSTNGTGMMKEIVLEGEKGTIFKLSGSAAVIGQVPAGTCVAFDNGGDGDTWMYSSRCAVRNIVIDGCGTALVGLYFQNSHKIATAGLEVRNVLSTGLMIIDCWVGDHNDYMISNMRSPGQVVPTNGVFLGASNSWGGVTCQSFDSIMVESCKSNGIYLKGASHCRFKGGTSQYNTNGVGVRIERDVALDVNSRGNQIDGMDLEVNGVANLVTDTSDASAFNTFSGAHIGFGSDYKYISGSDIVYSGWGPVAPNSPVGLISGTNQPVWITRRENLGASAAIASLDTSNNVVFMEALGAANGGTMLNLPVDGPSGIGSYTDGWMGLAYTHAGGWWAAGSKRGDIYSFVRTTNIIGLGTVSGAGIFASGTYSPSLSVGTNVSIAVPLFASGLNLTNIAASNIISGGVLPAGTVSGVTNTGDGWFLLNSNSVRAWGVNARALTNLNASELRAGTIPTERFIAGSEANKVPVATADANVWEWKDYVSKSDATNAAIIRTNLANLAAMGIATNAWVQAATNGVASWAATLAGQNNFSGSNRFSGPMNITTTGIVSLLDFPTNTAVPNNPPIGTIRTYSVGDNGFVQLENITDLGIRRRLNQDITRLYRNDSGTTITKGQAVYISGGTATRQNVKLAQANSTATMPAVAIATASVADQAFGEFMVVGKITGLKTDYATWADADVLYVNPYTAGALTNTIPLHTNLVQQMGIVAFSDNASGIIDVNAQSMIGTTDGTISQSFKVGQGTNLIASDGSKLNNVGFTNGVVVDGTGIALGTQISTATNSVAAWPTTTASQNATNFVNLAAMGLATNLPAWVWWAGPSNSLTLDGRSYYFNASTSCAVTNLTMTGIRSTLHILNTNAATAIQAFNTAANVGLLGATSYTGNTNGIAVAAAKEAVFGYFGFSTVKTNYANTVQQ